MILEHVGIGKFSIQILLGAWPGLSTPTHYEATSDPWVQHRQNAMINIGWVKLSPQ